MWSIVFIFTLMTLLLIIRQYRRKTTLESIMRELNSTNISNLESFRKMLHAKESTVELLVRNMVSFIQTTIDTTEKDSPVVIRKRIKETIIDIANEDFWKELRTYLDKNHNNVISNIAKNPRINESDIKFLELACCGFSYVEMAITLGYSTNYVSNKRIKIQKKLNLKQSLQDYLNEAMKGWESAFLAFLQVTFYTPTVFGNIIIVIYIFDYQNITKAAFYTIILKHANPFILNRWLSDNYRGVKNLLNFSFNFEKWMLTAM